MDNRATHILEAAGITNVIATIGRDRVVVDSDSRIDLLGAVGFLMESGKMRFLDGNKDGKPDNDGIFWAALSLPE